MERDKLGMSCLSELGGEADRVGCAEVCREPWGGEVGDGLCSV